MKWNPKCSCGKKKYYNEEYDAYYCKACDKWLEKNCWDIDCEFCQNRPEKPSNIRQDRL